MGAFKTILISNCTELGHRMKALGKSKYDEEWWKSFVDKLGDCTSRRNKCCHSGLFDWKEQSYLLADMFKDDTEKQNRNPKVGGLIFESKVGRELI